MTERERPPCIDGERCQHVSGWPGWHGNRIPQTNKRGILDWYCRKYKVYLRWFDNGLNVVRCAACRKEWPNER